LRVTNIFALFCFINFFLLEYFFEVTKAFTTSTLIIYATAFLFLPLFLTLSTTIGAGKNLKTKRWPAVQGRISSVEIKDDLFRKGEGRRFTILYGYYVKDRLHTNDQYNLTEDIITKSHLIGYPYLYRTPIDKLDGKIIKIFYNPDNPWESVISKDYRFDGDKLLIPSSNALIIILYLFYCIY